MKIRAEDIVSLMGDEEIDVRTWIYIFISFGGAAKEEDRMVV